MVLSLYNVRIFGLKSRFSNFLEAADRTFMY